MIKITNVRWIKKSGKVKRLTKNVERTIAKHIAEFVGKRFKRTEMDIKVV